MCTVVVYCDFNSLRYDKYPGTRYSFPLGPTVLHPRDTNTDTCLQTSDSTNTVLYSTKYYVELSTDNFRKGSAVLCI